MVDGIVKVTLVADPYYGVQSIYTLRVSFRDHHTFLEPSSSTLVCLVEDTLIDVDYSLPRRDMFDVH